ncbi:MAG: NmrA family NAD(P)-binding protein [Terriglobia bacterium]
MIAITGATGNTGSVIAERLLAQGEKVRVIGRDAGRLARFVAKGAEAFVADATDAAALSKAFHGASAVYAMIPPNMTTTDPRGFQERVSDALAGALARARVPHTVALSSYGADKPAGTGPVAGLHSFEQKLSGIAGLNAVLLRAGYFMENLLPQIQVIKNFGIVGAPLRPDVALSMIATRDIGAAVAKLFLKRDFTGKQTRELLGQRDVTYPEATVAIGKAIGRPDLAYKQLPPEQMKPAFVQMGVSAQVADFILELAEALNSRLIVPLEARSPANTTPTSIETFAAEEFAPRFSEKRG